jgi:BlaI family transcriptional regulator, penicillinase repressor
MPARLRKTPGGELEDAVLARLWARGSASARELYDDVSASRDIVYTTVAKVLDRLFAKGMVARKRSGRIYLYRAKIERDRTQRDLARDMVERLARHDARPAMAALVGAIEDVDPELLDELAALIEAKRSGHGT